MAKLHTDREILRCFFDMYSAEYPAKGDPLVPVDINAVAKKLGCDPHLLFGRLHYDFGTRLRHRDPKDPNLTLASIFEVSAGNQRHVVNFPYLAAVLASLEEKRRHNLWTVWVATAALIVAIGSSIVQFIAWARPVSL